MAFTCIVASVEHLRKQAPRKHSVSFPWPPHIDVYIPAFSDKLRHKYIRLRCFYYAQCNRLRYRKFRWISNNSTSKLQNDRIVFEMRLIFCTHLLWASTWTVSTTDWDFFYHWTRFFCSRPTSRFRPIEKEIPKSGFDPKIASYSLRVLMIYVICAGNVNAYNCSLIFHKNERHFFGGKQ